MKGRARGGGDPAIHPRLFGRGEMRLRKGTLGRLAELARTPTAPLSERERRASEDRDAITSLRARGAELAAQFGLRLATIEAERGGVNSHYGICHEDGTIRIRLRHATTGRLLKESSLVDTLCHELAHLRHFDHSPRFRSFYLRILDEARRRGFYRPGPERTGARQISLFDPGACGTH